MSRRRIILVGATATAIAVAAGAVMFGRGGGSGAAAGTTDRHAGATATVTAKVTTKDLAETQDVQGTLGYGEVHDLTFSGHGTITALAPLGVTVGRGGKLGEVDGAPVTLFFGERPAWRELHQGVPDGADIQQLEANLIALGYGTRVRLGPNRGWNTETTDAVKRWQHALGVPETGIVGAGDVVYEPGPIRVSSHSASVGGAAGPALKVSGTTRLVDVDLDAQYQSLVKPNQPVEVELPDGTRTPATITSVGSVAVSGRQGANPTIPVVVALRDPAAGGGLDEAPVTVHVVTTEAKGAKAVPVGALLALSEGGYAVEAVTGPGTTRLVGVQLGQFADGWVQVSGPVEVGDDVVVAR